MPRKGGRHGRDHHSDHQFSGRAGHDGFGLARQPRLPKRHHRGFVVGAGVCADRLARLFHGRRIFRPEIAGRRAGHPLGRPIEPPPELAELGERGRSPVRRVAEKKRRPVLAGQPFQDFRLTGDLSVGHCAGAAMGPIAAEAGCVYRVGCHRDHPLDHRIFLRGRRRLATGAVQGGSGQQGSGDGTGGCGPIHAIPIISEKAWSGGEFSLLPCPRRQADGR